MQTDWAPNWKQTVTGTPPTFYRPDAFSGVHLDTIKTPPILIPTARGHSDASSTAFQYGLGLPVCLLTNHSDDTGLHCLKTRATTDYSN